MRKDDKKKIHIADYFLNLGPDVSQKQHRWTSQVYKYDVGVRDQGDGEVYW